MYDGKQKYKFNGNQKYMRFAVKENFHFPLFPVKLSDLRGAEMVSVKVETRGTLIRRS